MCQAKVYHSQEIDFCVILFIAAPFFMSFFFPFYTKRVNNWTNQGQTRKNKCLEFTLFHKDKK